MKAIAEAARPKAVVGRQIPSHDASAGCTWTTVMVAL